MSYQQRFWIIPHQHACGFPICDSEQNRLIGYADTLEDAELIVDALNAQDSEDQA